VDAGVEGNRVPSQAALLGAVFKRNVGIPSSRGTVDLDALPDNAVDKFISVCFRDDWQEIVERHLNSGMWKSNEEDIVDFLAGVDEKKVKGMLSEFFVEGEVSLDRWLLMAKGKVKPAREVGSESRVDHSQTIMYLSEASTNAIYSAQTRRFKNCLDECLLPSIKLNPQWSSEQAEEWYNSREPVRKATPRSYCYTVDSKAFDRSQEHPLLRFELALYRRMGLSEETLGRWEETHGKKKAMSMMFGVIISMVLTGVSGLWKTLLRNGLVTLVALVVAAEVKRGEIVALQIKGDDVDAEVSRPTRVETAVGRVGLIFNLSTKFNTVNVRYFCKAFWLKLCGRWVEVADPWPRVQSLCSPIWIGDTSVSMMDRWVSMRADLRHYDNELAVSAVAEAAAVHYGLRKPLYGMARALSKVRADKNAYFSFFSQPELVG